jgi:hypothetical protein
VADLQRQIGENAEVTAVREQPAESRLRCGSKIAHESGVVLQCLLGPNHADERHASGEGLAVQWTDDDDRVIAGPEPQQADASPVLDLVRQYGDALNRSCGLPSAASMALFARIAALVPQQPVQARDESGWPWWIHGCGHVDAAQTGLPDECCDSGPWRPLLVGGDPAPEGGILAHARTALHERNAARAEAERLTSRMRHLEVELAGTQQMLDVMTAQPDPLVLSLPEVPEGTEALVGESSGARYPWNAELQGWLFDQAEIGTTGLGELLDREGSVRVELAPPREPRTWPKVDAAPVLDDPPETVQVNGWRWHLVDQSGGRYYQPGVLIERTIQQLRELGDVTEVTE